MHISIGYQKYEGDAEMIAGDRNFAIQAIKEGYAALVIEQRCFGERLEDEGNSNADPICHRSAMSAIMLGRTMIGERVWDVSRAIDTLMNFKEIDTDKIGCMGNSGGGTITFYASCIDERIKVCMPSCSICTFEDSLIPIVHCVCNFIPGIMKYFDMGDLACLISPRPLIVVAGRKDDIFPIDGAIKAYNTIEQVYKAAGAAENCRLVIGKEGHQFYAKQGWSAFGELSGWK